MSLYTRALKYIDMNRVKELHEEKIKQKEINEKINEEVIVYSDSEFCNWREETDLKESDWTPSSGSGPTNSSSQQFTYFTQNFQTGQPNTMNASVIGGDQEAPNSVTVDFGFGEVENVEGPSPSQYALQGYAPLLTPEYKDAEKKYLKEMEEYRKKRDENFQSIKDTLKSFGTSWGEMRSSNKWVKKLSDGTVVSIVPTGANPGPMNWTNNVAVTKLRQAPDADPMFIDYNPQDGIYDWVVINSEIQRQVLHEIGEPPVEPNKEDYLVSRRTDFKDVNPQLDASQEFTQNVGADYMMNARVQDAPPTPAYYPTDQSTVPGMVWIDNPMSINGGYWDYDSSKMGTEIAKVASVGLTQQEQEWLNDKQGLVNKLKIAQKFGGPAVDFAQWAINWAKGDYTPIKRFSSQMQYDVLDQISKTLANRPGTSGTVQYHDYGLLTNNSTRLGLGRFIFDIGPNGVRVKDNFDVNLGGSSVGGLLHMIPGLQNDANKITELGNKVGGGKGKIPIDITIPWSQVSPYHQNKLDPTATIIPITKRRRTRKGIQESTWNKLKKYRITN